MSNNYTISYTHQKISRYIESLGIGVRDEVEFFPYRVDCYLPEYHAAVEVDGPQHHKKKDKERDKYLLETYGLPVFHIKVGYRFWCKEFLAFLEEVQSTFSSRYSIIQDKCPWV